MLLYLWQELNDSHPGIRWSESERDQCRVLVNRLTNDLGQHLNIRNVPGWVVEEVLVNNDVFDVVLGKDITEQE